MVYVIIVILSLGILFELYHTNQLDTGLADIIQKITKSEVDSVPRRIVTKYTFVEDVADGNEQFFKRDPHGEPICHDCKSFFQSRKGLPGYTLYIIGAYVYLMNDSTLLCHKCGPPYNYRRNNEGTVVCSDCGGFGPFRYTADDSAVCIGCLADRCID